MYYIDKESLAFLDGYLRGLCVLTRTQKDISMGCGILDIQDDCIEKTFEELFFSELNIKEYNQNLINFDYIEKKIKKYWIKLSLLVTYLILIILFGSLLNIY